MADNSRYNLFIFISMVARNIVELFSAVFLYQKGYSLKEILFFFFLVYLGGLVVNYLVIKVLNKIRVKGVLIFSSLTMGISFLFLNKMAINFSNLIIYAVLFSLGSYSYHIIRHYLALNILDGDKKKVGSVLIFSYLAVMLASFVGSYITSWFGVIMTVIVVIMLSLISIMPLMNLKIKIRQEKINLRKGRKKIKQNQFIFFILEQFKVIFLSLQPLYLYIYVKQSLNYIGLFNIFLALSSIVFVYFFVRKINQDQCFKWFNIIFCLVLVLKLNLRGNLLLFLAFLEGIGIKMYETISLENVYEVDNKDYIGSYLLIVEFIFCGMRSLICLLLALFFNRLLVMLYVAIFFIFLSSFVKLNRYEKKGNSE